MLHTRRTVRCAGITLLVASALVGCGDDSTSDTGGTEGTGAGPGTGGDGAGGNATGTGGAGNGGDPGSGGSDPEDPIGSGYISVYSGSYNVGGNPSASYSATAAFTPPRAPTAECEQQSAGGCWIYSCPVEGAPPAGAPDAGVITLVAGAKTVTLTPSATGLYAPASDDEALWAAGQTLTVSAAGGEVPSFDMNVVAPAIVNVTAPAFPASPAQLVVPKANPLNVTWSSGGAAGYVSVYAGRTEGNTSVTVSCAFVAADGQGTIAPEALALIPSGVNGFVQVVSGNTATVTRPEWTITLNAGSLGATATGSASALATFE